MNTVIWRIFRISLYIPCKWLPGKNISIGAIPQSIHSRVFIGTSKLLTYYELFFDFPISVETLGPPQSGAFTVKLKDIHS